MNAKEYLGQAFTLDRRIDSKLALLSSLKAMASKTTSVMNDAVVTRTRNVHSMEDTIAKIVDTAMKETIRQAMYGYGFTMLEESDKGYNQPAYDTATRQYTVQWTWCWREDTAYGN